MDNQRLAQYMAEFEHYVIKGGIDAGVLGAEVWMPIRDGKLAGSPLEALIGNRFSYEKPAVIEYFGLHKRSTGFMEKAGRMFDLVRGFPAILVNFSSVKDEHIVRFAPHLLLEFSAFKQRLVETRFGKKKSD